jgi:cytochrome c oxidase subunit 3/cytochrome o ubiquinol oxidase subunit 3
MAERAIDHGKRRLFGIWWLITIVLGAIFILGTAREWYHLIYDEGLTISSSLFGTTFYSLVGLHGFHVIVGLAGLSIIMIFAAFGQVRQEHASRIAVFAMYWHFVDAVWVVVLTVVYFVAL